MVKFVELLVLNEVTHSRPKELIQINFSLKMDTFHFKVK